MRHAPIINVALILLGFALHRLVDLVFAGILVGAVFLGVVGVFDCFIPWVSSLAR